ncbi:MAG: hypothetical protein K2Y32_18015 [Candidatus Obscuribacterales bacterium]|nr:hypothetical protein [Candidatus Obscuribacterales bacterium]
MARGNQARRKARRAKPPVESCDRQEKKLDLSGSLALAFERNAEISRRLDRAIPLNTNEWLRVEQHLMRLSEFVPIEMLTGLTEVIALYADDQARRGYILGQDDSELAQREIA